MTTDDGDSGATTCPTGGIRRKKLVLFGTKVAEMNESTAWSLLLGASTGLIFMNCLGLPFFLPKLQSCLGAPYLPTAKKTVAVMFDHVLVPHQSAGRSFENVQSVGKRKHKLLDFGSGDGRIVFAAAKRGFVAVGYEINPYLYALSRWKAFQELNAEERSRVYGFLWLYSGIH